MRMIALRRAGVRSHVSADPPVARSRSRRGDEGFALLAVLWVIVGLSALALVARLAARDAVAAARNRTELHAAAWRAEDCVARMRAAVSAGLRTSPSSDGRDAWDEMDARVAASPLVDDAPCEVSLRAAGAGLDVNAADGETLRRFFLALGATPAAADSLADALADWRDADDEPRPAGAEAAWYAAAGRPGPRNGPLADPREVLRIRGIERIKGIDALVATDAGRIPLNHAPLPVLAALPGMEGEAVARVAEMRARGARLGSLLELEGALSAEARAALSRRYAELSALTAGSPDAWVMTARAREGDPPVTAVLEVRLVRAGTRAAVVRRRNWIE
jgi:type II secretory pathway component PulK